MSQVLLTFFPHTVMLNTVLVIVALYAKENISTKQAETKEEARFFCPNKEEEQKRY